MSNDCSVQNTNCDDDVINRVKKIISSKFIDASKITDETKIAEDLKADSLDTVELIMQLEEEFSIEIPDAEAQKMSTVGDVIRYIKGHIA